MNIYSRMKSRTFVLFGLSILALFTSASSASANVEVCNYYTSPIYFTATINDTPACSGSWREIGWWYITANTCSVLNGLPSDMTGLTIWYHARGTDGKEWGGTSTWSVPYASHNSCWSGYQLWCTNNPSSCTSRKHKGTTVAGRDYTIIYHSN